MDTFGSRLRAARETRGMTQESLCFELGVTKATVSKWETGRSEPTLEQLATLAEQLGRNTDYFLRPAAETDKAPTLRTRCAPRMPRRKSS